MVYLAFVNLFHDIFSFILSIIALYSSGNVLFRKNVLKNSATISPTLVVYFIFIFIWAIFSLIYGTYLIAFWRPNYGSYNNYFLYFTGLGPSISLMANSIAESLLCIERSASLIFPLKYSKSKQLWFATFTAFGIIFSIFLSFFINRYYEIIPKASETMCQSFACLSGDRFVFSVKITLNIINIFFAILLSYLIKRTLTSGNKNAKVINKTMVILISLTTSIELLPFFIGQIFYLITDHQLLEYIGSYVNTGVSLNITICAVMYFKTVKKLFNTQSKVVHLTTSNHKY